MQLFLDLVDKKKAKAAEGNEEGKVAELTQKKKGRRHHKKVLIKSNHLSPAEAQALHQKMLAATRDSSTLPMPSAVANAMPMQMPNIYGGPQVAQFPQQMQMNNFQPVTPEANQNTQSAQRDENIDNNDYGFEGNENPETTIMHKINKKARKKHHHHHHHRHHFKKEEGPINIYDLGKGKLKNFQKNFSCCIGNHMILTLQNSGY